MERLKEVLMRVTNNKEEELSSKLSRTSQLLESGYSPGEVLVEDFGTDTDYLEDLLNPRGF